MVALIVAIYYAGELVWRERDRRVHELVDASALPNWAYVVPKMAAMALVLMTALLTNVVASVILQLANGYTHLEPGKYLLWYVLPGTWDMLLLAALASHLQFELDEYLRGRAWGAAGEPPLARVEWQSWVSYHKGSLAMYLLQERMGEDAVNRALRNLLQRFKFKGPPYPRSLDLVEALRAEAKTAEEQNLITDLFERLALYGLKVTGPTAVRRADGRWDVTVPVEAKKLYADARGTETETPLHERIEVGLFTAEPGREVFDAKDVVLMERHPIRSGRQVLKFVTATKPAYAGVDPYNFYIDRSSGDNVVEVN